MKKLFLITSLLLLLSAGCAAQTAQPKDSTYVKQSMENLYTRTLEVGNKKINAQVVTTPAEMEQGLSDRLSMKEDEGMLFDFGTVTRPTFWMKDMNFGLDLIWIRGGQIVGITPDAPAPVTNEKSDATKLKLYPAPENIDQVLEVNADWAQKNSVHVGDEVSFQ